MLVPCVTIVIPELTSPVRQEPEYMAPIYQEIWLRRLASQGKMGVEIHPAPGVYKEVDSVYAEKADLQARFGQNPNNGQPLFDKIYPADTFEQAFDEAIQKEAAREIAVENPEIRVPLPDLMVIAKSEDLAFALEDLGLKTVADVASAPISKIASIKGFTAGKASKLLAVFAEAARDDAAAKAAADAIKAPEPKAEAKKK